MAKSFGIVENKIFEAEFFLNRLRESTYLSFESQCYFSAFISASRGVTFAMQTCLKGLSGFDKWYINAQNILKTDSLARFFIEARNELVHGGDNPLDKITLEHLREALRVKLTQKNKYQHFLIAPDLQDGDKTVLCDAYIKCLEYFLSLLSIVFDCYSNFKTDVDPKWYFTKENFARRGKTFADAVVEMGYPEQWADCAPKDETSKWSLLQNLQPPNQLNPIFDKYLGKTIKEPAREYND